MHIDGILTLDPAGVSETGIALRETAKALNAQNGWPRKPTWYWSGKIWSSAAQDDLARELFRIWPAGRPVVLLATNATTYRNTAMSQGQAVGCVRGLLDALNIIMPGPPVEVADSTSRAAVLPKEERARIRALDQGKRRAAWKAAAVAFVLDRYGIECDDNAAEAILCNDYLVAKRRDLWQDTGNP